MTSRRNLALSAPSVAGSATTNTSSNPILLHAVPPSPPLFAAPSWRSWPSRNRSLRQQPHHPIQQRSTSSTSRPKVERVAVAGMILIAWAWIMVFLGMIFYHGYQYRIPSGGRGAGDRRAMDGAVSLQGIIMDDPNRIQRLVVAEPDRQNDPEQSFQLEPQGSPLIIFTCSRANYLRDTLNDVLKYIPSDCRMGCPVIVSQDGHDPDVHNVITDFQTQFLERKGIALIHLEHKSALRRGSKGSSSYQALAVHYGWALRQVFDGHAVASAVAPPPQRVVILEEDLHIAPDFFDYFRAMTPILESDPSLLAVSAFNDNGFHNAVADRSRVLRSDFFPGLGWMLTRHLWTNELQLKWPTGWWDDWLREPAQRQGRHILRPEVSRTFHFGTKGGASGNQFGSQLGQVFLNDQRVDWTPMLPGTGRGPDDYHWSWYLQNEATFDLYYWNLIQSAQLVTAVEAAEEQIWKSHVRIEYTDLPHFQKLAKQWNPPLMDDEKAGIPRTAYKGVVETRPHGGDYLLFFTPAPFSHLQAALGAKTIALQG